jgi:hypothetical protein
MIERDEHYSVFKKPAVATTRYPTYKPEPPCNLDTVVQYFKFNELSKSVSSLSRWLPKNPYKNDFDAFVDEFFASHAHLPESETLRQLHDVLASKQEIALGSLRRVVSEDSCVPDMQQRIPSLGV